MRIYKLILGIISISVSLSSFTLAENPDKKKTDETTPQITIPKYPEGLVYSLPRTGFIIHVKAERTTFKPGPYYQFAQKYLGIENASGTEKVTWQITDISIDLFAEADPDAIFKTMDTISIPLSLLPNGVISDINGKGKNASTHITGNDFIAKKNKHNNLFTDLSSDDFYELLVNTESGTESMKIKNIEEKAREAADYIMRLRKKRAYAILDPSDVIPEDGKGYEVFVNEAKRLDQEYVALFVGKHFSSKQEYSLIFVPSHSNVKNEVLFRFSEDKGVLPKTDISGKPILLAITKENEAYNTANKLKASEHPEAGKKGIFYRIPVGASLILSDGMQTLYSGQATVAQFGIIVPVPENLLNGTYQIHYNTETGSIKNISEFD